MLKLNIQLSCLPFIKWQAFVCAVVISLPPPIHAADDQSALMRALFAKAFGKKKTIPLQVTADLLINSNRHGEVEVFSNKDNEIDRVAANILSLLEDTLKDDVLQQLKKEAKSLKKIPLSTLSKVGIEANYDISNISLNLSIAPDLRKPRILSMIGDSRDSLHSDNNLVKGKTSGFINLYSDMDISNYSQELKPRLRFEGSLNVNDIVFESTVGINNGKTHIADTLLTYDKPEKLYRYQAGDISTLTRGFQDSYTLTGISLTKAFFMDPKLQIKPRANASFILETSSDVDILINGQVQKSFLLDAGTYTLEDIGLFDGANNIVIRIKDEFGKITEKTTQQYYDAQLLKPGLSNFAISLGKTRTQQVKTNSDLANSMLLSGYYQTGIINNLTLGLDAQFSASRTLVGYEFITSIPSGRLQATTGISVRKSNKTGFAQNFIYFPSLKKLSDKSLEHILSSWSIRGEYRSSLFDNPVNTPPSHSTSTKAKLQTNMGIKLNENWYSNIVFGVEAHHDNDEVDSFSKVSLRGRLKHGLTWSIDAQYNTTDADAKIISQLIFPLSGKLLGRKQYARLKYDSNNNRFESQYEIKSLGVVDKDSIAGKLRFSRDDNNSQISSDLVYRNLKFDTHMNMNYTDSTQQLSMGFNTSLLCVDSHCTQSYPVSDSFVLVSGPDNQSKPIAIKKGYGRFRYSIDNESDLPDNYTALVKDKSSPAVVVLNSYEYQHVSIDEDGLPFGYDPDATEFEVTPHYHSGYIYAAGGEPGIIVDGILVDQSKTPLGFKGGQWLPEKEDGKIISFFTNKTGRFQLSSVPAGTYTLELFDHPELNTVSITIPDRKGTTLNIGELITPLKEPQNKSQSFF